MTKKDIPFRLRVSPDPSQIIAADTENVYRYELSELTSEDICFDEFGRIWVTKTEPNPRPELMQVDFIEIKPDLERFADEYDRLIYKTPGEIKGEIC